MTAPATRQRARDTRTDREGEVMARHDTAQGVRYYLRPVGGGKEWIVPDKWVQLLDAPSAGAA